jgi:hypothetical protein
MTVVMIMIMVMAVIVWMWMVMLVMMPVVMVMGVIVGMALCARGGHGQLLLWAHRRHLPDVALWSCYCWEV